jgi:tRNA(Ile)-lysidine synthase
MKHFPVSNFARNLRKEWRKLKLPAENQTVVVAVSGGADSCGLLLALDELKKAGKLDLKLIAAHFNHNLRGREGETDAEFVRDLANKNGVEFVTETAGNLAETKDNLEQAARRLRYEFLFKAALKYNAFAVLTAHTLNDQAETFLLNLTRGSGLEGLSGMEQCRKLKDETDILLIRPLLSWAERELTVEYCRNNKIDYCHDIMNKDENFNRVKIRKKIIPLLKEINPQIIQTIYQTTRLLFEDNLQLDFEAQKAFQTAVENDVGGWSDFTEILKTKQMLDFTPSVRRRVLRIWLEKARGTLRRLERKHIAAIERIIAGENGKFVELPDNEIIVKKGNRLAFIKRKVEKSPLDNYN